MKRGVIGAISGLVIGVAIGASVVAPRLNGGAPSLLRPAPSLKLGEGVELIAPVASPVRVEPLRKAAPPPEPAPEPTPEPAPAMETAKPAPVSLRMESAFPVAETAAAAQAARLARVLERINGGAMVIESFGPGQIVATEDLLSAVASGALDAAFASPGLWADRVPALMLFGALPFGPAPDIQLAWIFNGGGKAIYDDAYDAMGLKGLVCGVAPAPSSGWFARTLNTPEDFTGLRIHSSGPPAQVFERLGATTYVLDQATATDALADGALDGAIFSAPSVDLANGLKNPAPYYYFPGWQTSVRLLDLIINKDRWENLSTGMRAQLETACSDNLRHGLTTADGGQFTALMEIAEAGVEVHRWPAPVLDALKRAWDEVRAEIAANDSAFREGWTSLDRFLEDQAIWRELVRP